MRILDLMVIPEVENEARANARLWLATDVCTLPYEAATDLDHLHAANCDEKCGARQSMAVFDICSKDGGQPS